MHLSTQVKRMLRFFTWASSRFDVQWRHKKTCKLTGLKKICKF